MKKAFVLIMLIIPIQIYPGIIDPHRRPVWTPRKTIFAKPKNTFTDFIKVRRTADTTELLTKSAWIHKKRGEQIISYVRSYHFMKDGKFKIGKKKSESQVDYATGAWRRKENIIYTQMDGFPGEHENEIIKISEDTLVLYFHDKGVVDVFEKL